MPDFLNSLRHIQTYFWSISLILFRNKIFSKLLHPSPVRVHPENDMRQTPWEVGQNLFSFKERTKKELFFSLRFSFAPPDAAKDSRLCYLFYYYGQFLKNRKKCSSIVKKGHLKWFPWIFFGNFYLRFAKKEKIYCFSFFPMRKTKILSLFSVRRRQKSTQCWR